MTAKISAVSGDSVGTPQRGILIICPTISLQESLLYYRFSTSISSQKKFAALSNERIQEVCKWSCNENIPNDKYLTELPLALLVPSAFSTGLYLKNLLKIALIQRKIQKIIFFPFAI